MFGSVRHALNLAVARFERPEARSEQPMPKRLARFGITLVLLVLDILARVLA